MTIVIQPSGDDDFGETGWFRRDTPDSPFTHEVLSPDCYHCPYCGKPVGFERAKAGQVAQCPTCNYYFSCSVEIFFVGKSCRRRPQPSDN